MKLGEIRIYLKRRGEAPLADVAIHFDISREAAALALDYWIKKGKVATRNAACGGACGGSCGSGSTAKNYQWLGTETRIQWYKHS